MFNFIPSVYYPNYLCNINQNIQLYKCRHYYWINYIKLYRYFYKNLKHKIKNLYFIYIHLGYKLKHAFIKK